MIEAKHDSKQRVETPETMVRRVFAVAQLLAKARSAATTMPETSENPRQNQTRSKTTYRIDNVQNTSG
jgi:hypothetical protein